MRGALLAAVLFLYAAAPTQVTYVGAAAIEGSDSSNEVADIDDDGEGDFAPFMIVVEHADGWRCAGSLVSLRTALTSAWCVRGRGAADGARDLWALAAAAAALPTASPAAAGARVHGARRVSRVAVATGADAEVSDGAWEAGGSWRGGALDLALVELEQPFGSAAHARPILMATSREECARGACHVSRALPGPSRRALLRIVSAEIAPPDTCARAAPHWTAVRDRALCLVGPELCASDWGGGVVCGGKLCGVLSRSVGARGPGAGGDHSGDHGGDHCGDTHAAQSVSLWRRFLHCAHTLRACGRGGDCADLCEERRLLEEATPPPASAAPAPARVSAATTRPTTTLQNVFYYATRTSKRRESSLTSGSPSRTFAPRTPAARRSPSPAPTAPAPSPATIADDAAASSRPSFEFEPNRADFKAPSRSSRAYLKAGEYGDNAAEYGGEEMPAPTLTAAPPAAEPRAAEPPAPAANPPPAERQEAADQSARRKGGRGGGGRGRGRGRGSGGGMGASGRSPPWAKGGPGQQSPRPRPAWMLLLFVLIFM